MYSGMILSLQIQQLYIVTVNRQIFGPILFLSGDSQTKIEIVNNLYDEKLL